MICYVIPFDLIDLLFSLHYAALHRIGGNIRSKYCYFGDVGLVYDGSGGLIPSSTQNIRLLSVSLASLSSLLKLRRGI